MVLVGEKKRKLSYRDIKYDPDGWVDAKVYLPGDYDLMYLKIKDKKSKSGWVVGKNWDGLKIENGDEVLYWKRKPEESVRCKTGLQ